MTIKLGASIDGRSWWFCGCISYSGTSVTPPLQMPVFGKIIL
ncbi:MAG: hypothetical protein ACW9W3_03605 [Candidatus Nitrosopumilus sp. bin_68KS]